MGYCVLCFALVLFGDLCCFMQFVSKTMTVIVCLFGHPLSPFPFLMHSMYCYGHVVVPIESFHGSYK